MQKRIVCGMVASLSLVWGAMALTNEERVGLAAADPQQVAELVAAMDAKATPLFAGEVVEAIASMPLSPVLRLRQMRDSAAAFLQAVPAAQRPELLGLSKVKLQFIDDAPASSAWSRGETRPEAPQPPCGSDCRSCPYYGQPCAGCPASIFGR